MNKENSPFGLDTKDNFYIRNNNILTRIQLSDIFWIRAEGNYCEISVEERNHAVRTSLKKLAEMLPEHQFVQIHKSYIIRLDKIEKLDTNESVVWVNGNGLPLGRTYKDKLMQRLNII
jgi:DNA-binding LytR/AlgR family response regulator